MGVWNSHTSVGNILGSLIAGVYVSSAWGMSFIVPGLIIAATGVVCFFFLVESKKNPKVLVRDSEPCCEPTPANIGCSVERVDPPPPDIKLSLSSQLCCNLPVVFSPLCHSEPEDVNCCPPQHSVSTAVARVPGWTNGCPNSRRFLL